MNIFISWSGERSQRVASTLSQWLKVVIQASRPWISTRDIDRGALWFSQIGDQLKDTTVGIVCLTAENKDRPWILFEAGALAKGLASSRVCTLLIDLQPADLVDPLAQFNHTTMNREGIWDLVRTLNAAMTSGGLDDRTLEEAFDVHWPRLEAKFAEILRQTADPSPPPVKSENELLKEILNETRKLGQRISKLEKGDTESLLKSIRTWGGPNSNVLDLTSSPPSWILPSPEAIKIMTGRKPPPSFDDSPPKDGVG